MLSLGQVRSGQVRSGSTRCHPILSMLPNLRTCNTHEVWIPKYVVDGPRDEYQKDATIANDMMLSLGLRSEVRMPTRQPSLGREPVRKQV